MEPRKIVIASAQADLRRRLADMLSGRMPVVEEVGDLAGVLAACTTTDCLVLDAALDPLVVLGKTSRLAPTCAVVVVTNGCGPLVRREWLMAGAAEVVDAGVLGPEVLRHLVVSASERQATAHESEAILRNFYEHSGLMMGVVELPEDDSDIIHIYDNPTTEEFFQVPKGSLAGRSANELGVPADVRDAWIGHYRASQRTGQPVRFEYSHPQADKVVWLSTAVAHIGFSRKGLARFSYVTDNITRRKLAEEQLREGEQQLAMALNAGQLGFWDWNIQTGAVVFGGHWGRMLGYAEDEIEPHVRSWERLLHPDEVEQVSATLNAHLAGQTEFYECEHRLRHKDGSWRWILDRGQVVARDAQGKPLRAIGTHADVTERHRAEERLSESESFYRQTLESIPGTSFTCSPEGGCDYISHHWIEFTGVPLDQQLGYGWVMMIHPDDRKPTMDAWQAALQNRSDYDLNFRVRRHDGAYKWFKVRTSPIRDAAGKVVRWFGAAINVDELVRAEENLREADRRKDEFLAMLAHELRNPLAPILNAVEVLRLTQHGDASVAAVHDVIERQVRHLVHLVDDLLDVSRVSTGKIQLRRGPLNLCDSAVQAAEMYRPVMVERGQQLDIQLPDEPVMIDGDPTRIAQVIGNLLSNASKYSDRGDRIELSVARDADPASPFASVRVRDNGQGIEPAALNNLFDLFYQAEHTLERSQGGLGLGLSLVRSLVHMHGGSVRASSAGRGHGSEFVVRLPLLATPPASAASPSGAGVRAATPLRTLVVDDNLDSASSMAMLLRLKGHEVHTAHDGEEAVQLATHLRPDLILLDLGLPKMNGYEACRAMRSAGMHDTIIVAMTGYGQAEDRRKSEEASFNAHLVKPVNLTDILSLLGNHKPEPLPA